MSRTKKSKEEFGAIILRTGCSLSCVFCGGHAERKEIEIAKQEREAHNNLKKFKEDGFKNIVISGSDPIEYEYIAELIKYIKKEGFKSVRLSTHGVLLSSQKLADKLIRAGLNQLKVPIYGSNAQIHDSVTGKKGSFEDTVTGIRYILKNAPQIKFEITTIVVKQNKDDLVNIVDFVNHLRVNSHRFSTVFLMEDIKNIEAFYIPLKNLPVLVKPLYSSILQIESKARLFEIPFCVVGKLDTKNIDNQVNIPQYVPRKEQREWIPSYRRKKKIEMCKKCKAFDFCDGFLVKDINRFGTGKLQAIE